jgi:hypothetical protein
LSSSRPDTAGGWRAPLGVGVAVALLVFWVTGSLTRPAVVIDESAYLLQAGIFAKGHWTGLAPPLPEFFEQLYVLVTPVLASKYPYGHSLVLAPAVWVGLPGLAPIILSGLTAALLYALARRVAGQWVALLTILWWLSNIQTLYARVTYMSEVTTAATWLLAWWGVLRWRDRRSMPALALCGLAVGWTLITRPLTGVALAIPLAVVLWRARSWRAATVAVAAAVAVVAIVPLGNLYTTGDGRETPLALYTRLYMPFDGPGFGAGTALPVRPLPPDLAATQEFFYRLHRDHHLASLPGDLVARVIAVGRDVWGGWRVAFLPFAILGIIWAGPEMAVAIATVSLLILLYLSYPHPASYTLYYLEGESVLAFFTAYGLVRAIGRLRYGRSALITCAAVFAVADVVAARSARATNRADVQYPAAFDALMAPLGNRRAIVFVDYASSHNANISVIRNVPDERDAPIWIVHDRGSANARLEALAPDRTPYRFDEAAWRLSPLTPP